MFRAHTPHTPPHTGFTFPGLQSQLPGRAQWPGLGSITSMMYGCFHLCTHPRWIIKAWIRMTYLSLSLSLPLSIYLHPLLLSFPSLLLYQFLFPHSPSLLSTSSPHHFPLFPITLLALPPLSSPLLISPFLSSVFGRCSGICHRRGLLFLLIRLRVKAVSCLQSEHQSATDFIKS